MNQVLNVLYGKNSRAAQWLNILVCVTWVVVAFLQAKEIVLFALPGPVMYELDVVVYTSLLSLIFSVIGIVSHGSVRQVAKSFGLITGALSQAVIANGYVTAYPPLDMMLVVSTALCLWLFGAVFYITRCEGLDGMDRRTT